MPGALPPLTAPAYGQPLSGYQPRNNYDVAVIGAGVFGSWIAHHLLKAGKKVISSMVTELPMHAPVPAANRASFAWATAPMKVYTRFSKHSLDLWKAFFQRTGQEHLFLQTGMLWLSRSNNPQIAKTADVLTRVGINFENLSRAELEKRFPQFHLGSVGSALFEPKSGALLARRAVQAVVADFVRSGGHFLPEPVNTPTGSGALKSVETRMRNKVSAGSFVFACGPWLPKVFPELLGKRIFPTRQEVFFFGIPPGDRRWSMPAMPVWIDVGICMVSPTLKTAGSRSQAMSMVLALTRTTGSGLSTKPTLQRCASASRNCFPASKTPRWWKRVCASTKIARTETSCWIGIRG
jgi:glycine/D-amino acid oxidase-like deaminating enzyme